VHARQRVAERGWKSAEQAQCLLRSVAARCHTPGLAQVGTDEADEHIRQICEHELLDVHLSSSLRCSFCAPGIGASSRSFCSSDGRSLLRSFALENSLSAAMIASASRPLKNTRKRGVSAVTSFLTA